MIYVWICAKFWRFYVWICAKKSRFYVWICAESFLILQKINNLEKNSQAEIDFIFKSRRYGIMPVEVKSGHNAHLKSLQLFMQQSPCTSAVLFWGKPKSVDKVELPSGKSFILHNLPYYYAGEMEEIIKNRE